MRILYIAALLSMCILLGTAFFALRGIRRKKPLDPRRDWIEEALGAEIGAEIGAKAATKPPAKTAPASVHRATSGAHPAYIALLQGMVVGMAIVLLARAQQRMLEDGVPRGNPGAPVS